MRARVSTVLTRWSRAALAVLAAATISACALRSPSIAELHDNPARYHDRTVRISGVVTDAWGVPLVPLRVYRVDDGTGALTVLAQHRRTPTRGARVTVKGRVGEVAVVGGRAVGLHLRADDVDVRR